MILRKKEGKNGEKNRKNRGRMNEFISNVNKWGRNNKGWSGGGGNEFIRNLQKL